MRYFSIAMGVIVSIFAVTVFVAPLARVSAAIDPHSDWELIAEFHGDRFVLDHNLTLVDCLDLAPRHDPAHEFYTACERPK